MGIKLVIYMNKIEKIVKNKSMKIKTNNLKK